MGAVQMKKILICTDASPFDEMRVREALDMTLIFAAVEQDVSLLLHGPAVLALKDGQTPQNLGLKNYFKSLKTLDIYDVEQVYACEASFKRYGLTETDLLMKVEVINTEQQSALIASQDQVVTL